MKMTARQKEIRCEIEWHNALRNAYQGPEPFCGRSYSKRRTRLLREFWAIERAKGGAAHGKH